MREPQPIIVAHQFSELLEGLLAVLSGLSPEDWERPTVCEPWSVREVALHLLGAEVGILSRKRDGFSPPAQPINSQGELLDLINHLNATWVQATRRISPRLLCDLLRLTGNQVCHYYQSLDPNELGGPVSWAGPDPAPVWLDLAREYTERWHHQQHIRDAVGKPGFKEPRFFAPVLDAFVRALPYTFRETDAADGTLVALKISGESGGQWYLLREAGRWRLHVGMSQQTHAQVIMDQDVAWRACTKGIGREEARAQATILGDQALGLKVLDMVSIIA